MEKNYLKKFGFYYKKDFFKDHEIFDLIFLKKYAEKIILLARVRLLIARLVKKFISIKTEKNFLINLINYPKPKKIKTILKNFTKQKKIIKIIEEYYNTKPNFHGVSILYSPAIKSYNKFIKSQLFHFDKNEDNNLIKVFIPLSTITYENGPFTYLNKIESKLFKNDKSKIEDTIVFKKIKTKAKINTFLGKPGDILIINTSECLHCGSRDIKKYRLVLLLVFTKGETRYSQSSKIKRSRLLI
jgi:hypothetical protein